MKASKPFLIHIAEEIRYLEKNSANLTYDDFMQNETYRRSFVRALEVIGEAAKNLPQGFRKRYQQVPWKEIAGLRDVLIHQYFGINYISLWDIVKNKIPVLRDQIAAILNELNSVTEN